MPFANLLIMPTCADYWLEVCCVRLSDWQMISTEYRKCLRVQYKWLHLPTITECFKKSSPLKLFGIFSLRLGLFCMKFYKFVGNSYPHNYIYQFLYIYLNISSNGVNFSTSTQHFPCQVWVLNADVSWARTWWESHHFQLYPDKGWKLSTVKKVCSRVATLAQPFCVNQTVGLGDLPQRLHAQFVVLRQFSHWQALPSFKTMSVKRQ